MEVALKMGMEALVEQMTPYRTDRIEGVKRLEPTEASLLRIEHGRVWLTRGLGVLDASDGYGDYFLAAGESIAVEPGQRVVIEPIDKNKPVLYSLLAVAGVLIK